MEGTNVSEVNNNDSTAAAVCDEASMILIKHIRFWWGIFIVPTGIAGNILCILVMSQKNNRSISCSVYITALAVCDIIYLIANASYVFFDEEFDFEQGVIFCKGTVFPMISSSRSGTMIIVALLVERIIAIKHPIKAAVLLSLKRAMIIMLVIVFLTLAFNLPYILSISRIPGGTCLIAGSNSLFCVIHNLVGLFLFGLIPLISILLLNLMILFKIKSSKFTFRKQRKAEKMYAKNISTVSNSNKPNTTSKGLEFRMDVMAGRPAVHKNITEGMTSPKQNARKNHASIRRASEGLDNPVMEESEIKAVTGEKQHEKPSLALYAHTAVDFLYKLQWKLHINGGVFFANNSEIVTPATNNT